MANNRSLNTIFGRSAVVSSRPDDSWPLVSDFVGIEIEVEDYDGNYAALMPEWVQHADHSLRNGVEFVTSSPMGGVQLTSAINKFFDSDHSYTMSPRTSIHIHVNASDNMSVEQFRNMLVLMYVIEPAVFRWADENRKWCGYCAPLTDITPSRFVTILNENDNEMSLVKAIRGENGRDRYFGFNMAAYAKHGTVEFRYFPCSNDKETVIKWIKFVMYVKKAALTYDTVPEMLAAMDGDLQMQTFIQTHFPDVADRLMNNLDTLDAQERVRDLLSSVLVKPSSSMERKPISASLANPAVKRVIAKNWPERSELLEETKGVDNKADMAHRLFDLLIRQGEDRHQAYARVADVYDSGAAFDAFNRSVRQEAQRQQANARPAAPPPPEVYLNPAEVWSTNPFDETPTTVSGAAHTVRIRTQAGLEAAAERRRHREEVQARREREMQERMQRAVRSVGAELRGDAPDLFQTLPDDYDGEF